MKNKIAFLLLTFALSCCFNQYSLSQINKADSLRAIIKTGLEDTNKVNTMLTLYLEIMYKSPDEAALFARQGLILSEKLSFKKGMAAANRMIGLSLYYKGEYDSARIYYNNSLALSKDIGDTTGIVKALMNIASIEESQGWFENALKLDQQGLSLLEHSDNKQLIAKLYNNIGAVHFKINNYNKSLDYFFMSLELKKQIGDKQAISNTLDNIAEIYRDHKKEYDKALQYNFESLEIRKQINDQKGIADSYSNIGMDYQLQNKVDLALEYMLNAFKLQEAVGNKKGVGDLCVAIGKISIDKTNFTNALFYLEKGLAMGKEMNSKELISDCSMGLSRVYAKQHNYTKAYHYDQLYIDVRDSMLNEKNNKTLLEMESKYENEKKQKEIQLLSKDKEIQAAEIERQTLIKNSTLSAVGIVGIFSFLLVYSFNRRKKASFEKLISVTEMKALRAQMNPHFIFNSLHSINKFVMDNDKLNAASYLSDFAKLMRLILENSREQEVSLEKDLDALKLYMQLESLRFQNRFRFTVEVDDELDQEATLIPPLLLQPFVENAILHGLKSKDDGLIKIKIIKEDKMIRCMVEDNGIGREQKVEDETGEKKKRASLGMKITKERLDIINQQKNVQTEINIVDLADADGKPCGLRIEILLPLEEAF